MRRKPGRTLAWIAPALGVLALCCGPAIAAKTPRPSRPLATTEAAAEVTFTTANLYAKVNPNGSPTSFFFELGLTSTFTSNTYIQSAGAGRTGARVGTAVSGLTPGTTYYYRVVALSERGESFGAIMSFVTPKVPLGVAFTNVQDPVPYGAPVTVEGALSGSEAANREVVLQANPYPYTGGFQQVGNPLITSATGTFAFSDAGLSVDTQLRVVTVGGTVVVSPILNEEVSVLVSLHAQATHQRGYERLYGNINPGEPGFPIAFQVQQHGSWTWLKAGHTAAKGNGRHYSTVIRLRRHGRYRAVLEARGERTWGYSNQVPIG